MYGPFTNEVLVGRAIRDRRDKVALAMKFANVRGQRVSISGFAARPNMCAIRAMASLRLVSIPSIFTTSPVDPNVPIEEIVSAMADLVRAGEVRHLGLSEAAPETIRRAHPITALQTEYSLWTRDIEENGVLATVRELGSASSPTARIDSIFGRDHRRRTLSGHE